jgi:hypothetical protein
VAAIVQCKRGRFGVLTRHRGKEKWQTVGAGEEGRTQAQELAAEINRQLEEERAREESEFLSPGAALPIDRALRDWLFHYGPTVGRSTLDRYRSLVDHQLVPYFGGKDLGNSRRRVKSSWRGWSEQRSCPWSSGNRERIPNGARCRRGMRGR